MESAATSANIRKGDQVYVITGRDKGKSGRVLGINLSKRTVTVEHVGIIKRHTPAESLQEREGRNSREGRPHRHLECSAGLPRVQ